jgi:hypothetical protein
MRLKARSGGYGELHRRHLIFTTEDTEKHRRNIYKGGPRARPIGEGLQRHHFFRSTRNLARDFKVSAFEPSSLNDPKAASTNTPAFFSDSPIPNNAG